MKILVVILISAFLFAGCTSSDYLGITETDVGAYERNDDYSEERDGYDMDCTDFSDQEEAQDFFDGNNTYTDPHNLDRDGDGYACESN